MFVCRLLLAYVMIQKFIEKLRGSNGIATGYEDKDTFLPDGVLKHICSFLEKYGLEECSRQTLFFPCAI